MNHASLLQWIYISAFGDTHICHEKNDIEAEAGI